MPYIRENTFAAACYDQNSISELKEAIQNGPDKGDMETWNITAHEWFEEIRLALQALYEDENLFNLKIKKSFEP